MESIGAYLMRERELRQVSLEELFQLTRIPLKSLSALEEDRFEDLPGEVFVRGFLRSCAVALDLDCDDLLERYDRGHVLPEVPQPLTMVAPPERGRRFGIAIALVILLILFTLAFSIVLQPRNREMPMQLSDASSQPWLGPDEGPSRTCT